MEKEKGYQNGENTSESKSNVGSSSERKEEEIASVSGSEAEDTRRATTLKTTVRKQKVIALKRPPPFTLKILVNIVRILMCAGHWSWNVLNALGTIHTRFVLYLITRSPRGEITWLWGNNTQKRGDIGNHFLFPLYRGERRGQLIFFIVVM